MKFSKLHKYNDQVRYNHLDMYTVAYHPNYFIFLDKARNQAFKDFGYSVEDQLKDKVGFTVASMDNISFRRPLFMNEEITIYTKCFEKGDKSCKVKNYITLTKDYSDDEIENLNSDPRVIFSATLNLVFVSIKDIPSWPLNSQNIKDLKTVIFSDKIKKSFDF